MKQVGAIEFARRVLAILLFIALGVIIPESTAETNSGLAGAR
jgi:hypothetical protein